MADSHHLIIDFDINFAYELTDFLPKIFNYRSWSFPLCYRAGAKSCFLPRHFFIGFYIPWLNRAQTFLQATYVASSVP